MYFFEIDISDFKDHLHPYFLENENNKSYLIDNVQAESIYEMFIW